MVSAFWISYAALWVLVLLLGFLLLGTLRSLGLLSWQLEQLQAVRPSRLGRDGLKPGKKAPDFTLPSVVGSEVSLHDYNGQKVLLVFVQGGCNPCHQVVPALNKRQRSDKLAILAVFNGPIEAAQKWATEVRAEFAVLSQQQFAISKRYEVFATPFAFLIDEKGLVRSKGIVSSAQHVGYVLAGRGVGAKEEKPEGEASAAEEVSQDEVGSSHSQKEVSHV